MSRTNVSVASLLAKPDRRSEIHKLRDLLLNAGLGETVKWGQLCYTFDPGTGRPANIALIFRMKRYSGIGFFKGALMPDPKGILHQQGENSQAVRLIRFENPDQISALESTVQTYLQNAIEIEKSGLKIDFAEKRHLVLADELRAAFADDPAFETAFSALTPGRQRGYNLHFCGAKQSATRHARIARHRARILDGKGLNDR